MIKGISQRPNESNESYFRRLDAAGKALQDRAHDSRGHARKRVTGRSAPKPLTSRTSAAKATAPRATVATILRKVSALGAGLRAFAATSEALQAGADEAAILELLASRPDLSEAFRDKLRGKTLTVVERVLAHLPAPSAHKQRIDRAMGVTRLESHNGAELRGSRLVFGAARVVRSEGAVR